jgi:pimeloyl-ACP methyl ester carboxylesterase
LNLESSHAGPHPPVEQRARAGDIDVAYYEFGKGPYLLLIAGLGGVKELWTGDNRGMGGTTAGTKEFSIRQFAEDSVLLMDSLGVDRAHFLGYSMGGYVVQELAVENPDRVDRLVLMGTECGGAFGIRQEPGVLLELTAAGAFDDSVEKKFFLSADWLARYGGNLADIFGDSGRIDDEATAMQMEAVRQWNGTCARLPEVDKPTLVVTGTEDIVILPENAKVLSELIPGSRLVELEGGDHGFIARFPAELAGIVADFLSS